MKKYIILLILLATMQLRGIGQSDSVDSICFSLEQNHRVMRWVEERDECLKKNILLKQEIVNLEFSNDKCNDKIFTKNETINKLQLFNSKSFDKIEAMQVENSKLKRKLKRRKLFLYITSGALFTNVFFLIVLTAVK